MSSEAPAVPLPGAAFAERARTFHALTAALAALALSVLFAWDWSLGEALRNPLPAVLIVVSLAVGAGWTRMIALRLNRVSGVKAVSALLLIAKNSEPEGEDSLEETTGRKGSALILNVMSLQIALTGVAAVITLLVLALFPGTLAGLDAWPGLASIVLLEAIYIAWLSEGMAVADELIVVALRWVRSGERGLSSPVPSVQRPSQEDSLAARARFLCDVLVRYGVDLNTGL